VGGAALERLKIIMGANSLFTKIMGAKKSKPIKSQISQKTRPVNYRASGYLRIY
jgi:hypothetical protein